MSDIFLITGVNGIGKSTLLSELKKSLDSDVFSIHDFDERGVPDNADKIWRQSETFYWIELGKKNKEVGRSTIICGFMKFPEIRDSLEQLSISANICLLDANDEIISKRILGRYLDSASIIELERTTGKTPENFVADNIWVSSQFRKDAQENNYYIVDTSTLSPGEAGNEITTWILSK